MRVLAVPVKPLNRSKTRLASVLSPAERASLTLTMLEDVLDACLAQAGWETWVISGPGPALDVAARRGARPVVEESTTLLGAVRQAEAALAARSTGTGSATTGSAETVSADELAVILADLPAITPRALAEALALPGTVVAAPASSDGGTNLLLRRPPSAIGPKFGRASFQRHRAAAYRAGLTFMAATVPGLGFDLDRPEDLGTLLALGPGSRTESACREMGLMERLRVTA